MKSIHLVLLLAVSLFSSQLSAQQDQKKTETTAVTQEKKAKNLHQFQIKDIHGKDLDLKKYKGKTVLMVNVASKCGFTHHYKGLQDLYSKYKEKGLVVIGVPCNQFGGQEPGNNLEILDFCKSTYEVSFPLTDKVKVKGKEKHPVFKFLTGQKSKNVKPGEIRWNFEKFVINSDGNLVGRFSTRTKPSDKKLVKLIEDSLKKSTK